VSWWWNWPAATGAGALVALHYAVQMARPRMGFGSDVGRRRTPWIAGGMAVLALGGAGAALATAWMSSHPLAGMALAALLLLPGRPGRQRLRHLAAGAAGHAGARTAPCGRRHRVWVMMIVGFAVTAGLAGRWLDPYSPARLVMVSATVSSLAFCWRCWPWPAWSVRASPCPADGKPAFRLALARSGKSPTRAASRSSCLSRCWPTARRT
jgi:BCD family chlorophyll transporter-like MFS transporter